MPIESKAQERLMEAAAHTKGGFAGVPEKVGKEFVEAGPAKAKLPERKKASKESKAASDEIGRRLAAGDKRMKRF